MQALPLMQTSDFVLVPVYFGQVNENALRREGTRVNVAVSAAWGW